MDPAGVEDIAGGLCRLLQEQVEAVANGKFTDEELAAYEKRKARIMALRSELQKFVKPT